MKDKYILGNWKQNGSLDLLAQMAELLSISPWRDDIQVGIFPPALFLSEGKKMFDKMPVMFGIQNVSPYADGAYTGEIAASMCLSINTEMALIGHSERRRIFNESNELCAKKFKRAADARLIPVFCIGESLSEYEEGLTEKVLMAQLSGIRDYFTSNFIIAYEPIWAIGSGKAATPENAQRMHVFIRQTLPIALQQTPIIYGGSVNGLNAGDFMKMPDIDGVLVGAASLDPITFQKIIASAG